MLRDSGIYTAYGAGAGIVLVLWVLFLDVLSGGALHSASSINFVRLNTVYVLGLAGAGAVAGLLRPCLGRLFGQALLAFSTAFAMYGGVALISSEKTITGNPIKDGLLIACFATPLWIVVAKSKGWDLELKHFAVGSSENNSHTNQK